MEAEWYLATRIVSVSGDLFDLQLTFSLPADQNAGGC